MNKTANFQLNQWEKTDRVMMDDFNADNAKIEAALLNRNCQFYTATYKGDGNGSKTWTFPSKPIMVLIAGQSITTLIQGSPIGFTQFGANSYQLKVTWNENSVTWTNTNGSGIISGNDKENYGLFAILEAQ